MDLEKIDKYLSEDSANKGKFEVWARERDGQTLTAVIAEGGMVLAICTGKFHIARSSIPDWRVHGKSSEVNFPYAAYKANPVKIMGKEGWQLAVMRGNLTYEIY